MENYGITQDIILNKYGENTENINANVVFNRIEVILGIAFQKWQQIWQFT